MMRAFTENQVVAMRFPISGFVFPKGEGVFNATLVMKKWANNKGLLCYFETDCGKKYKLMVGDNPVVQRKYRPQHSDTDISHLPFNSKVKVAYHQDSTGNTLWNDVEVLSWDGVRPNH